MSKGIAQKRAAAIENGARFSFLIGTVSRKESFNTLFKHTFVGAADTNGA
jgi:hypothetical protein